VDDTAVGHGGGVMSMGRSVVKAEANTVCTLEWSRRSFLPDSTDIVYNAHCVRPGVVFAVDGVVESPHTKKRARGERGGEKGGLIA
jgi:hypothetical protein